jgi:3-polyprenyl-4-hydroxybenzoate decarboxylase
MPGVVDLWSYGETGYHSLSAAIVRERYEREAFASAFRILGEGQISLTKFLLLTDGKVDLRDFSATLRHVLERTDPRTDLLILPNLSMDSLDYSGPVRHRGSKGVLVGLGEARRSLPHTIPGDLGAGISDARMFTPGALVVQTASYEEDPHAAERIAKLYSLVDWPLIVISDDAQRATLSNANFLWTTFTRFDPGQDIVPGDVRLVGSHAAYSFPLVIDARMKPSYPEELFCDDATAQTVSKRWKEYFPAGGVEMGASDQAHLD